VTRRWMLLLLLAICAGAARAESGIESVVRVIEARYPVRPHGIPGMWLAKPFMIGSGASGMKMQEFEDLKILPADRRALKDELTTALGPDWHPFVEQWSKSDGEWSLIYIQRNTGKTRMLIITADEEVSLLQMDLSRKAFREWVDKPVDKARHKGK
jgi:hypothetical protein